MTQPPSNYRVSVKALITDGQGRLLLVKEDDDPWWGLPGGGLDHGETVEEGLRRELREEVGATLASFEPRPEFVWTFHLVPADADGHATPGFKMWLVYQVQLKGDVRPTSHQVKWFAPGEIKKEDHAPYFTGGAFQDLLAWVE